MALRVSGKNLNIGESLKTQVETRLAGALARYFDGSYRGHVTVARDGAGFRTDCVLHLSTGTTLEASGEAGDAYASFDRTADRIERRLKRYRQRLKSRPAALDRGAADPARSAPESLAAAFAEGGHGSLAGAYAVLEPPTDESVAQEAYHPVVIAEETRALHRLSVGEAVIELDLTGAPVLVFLHASTGRLNVVYRRRDGAIGWVDPPTPPS